MLDEKQKEWVRPHPITYVGVLDPKEALAALEEYFTEVSDEELYNDLLESAPELIDHFSISKPVAA